jgi:hypothetical protein
MKNTKEHFDKENARNVCHHACSSMNYINILMIGIIFIIVYHFLMTKLI